MPHRPIRIVTSDLSLAEQLRVRLDSVLDHAVTVLHSITETTPPAVVVTTTSACSADECAGLTQSGVDVVVLAALPSTFQEDTYRQAGAAHYLPMSMDIAPLALALAVLI